MGFTHTHKLNQLDRNNDRSFSPLLKLTRPLAVWQESKVSVTNFGFQPFQCVVSFRQERVVFFLKSTKKSPHLALDYILTPS